MTTSRESSKPFVIRQAETPKEVFAKRFLASHDFDTPALRNICRSFGLSTNGSKKNLLDRLEVYFFRDFNNDDGQIILEQLILRNKNWFTFHVGGFTNIPNLQNPLDIIFSPAKSGWYGPIMLDNANWYIRVNFISQWEYDEIKQEKLEYQIRWLCFAQVFDTYVSLHWQGFSLADKEEEIDHENQFPYWKYIPIIFDEFQKTLGGKLKYPLLHKLVLHDFWDMFRLDPNYEWEDLRIRAESGGVSLNVQSPGKSASDENEINISNIKHLASTLTTSVAKELKLYPMESKKQKQLEETILRTLIREFGAKSYEFSLSHQQTKLLRAHFYFGNKPDVPSRDCFPHINCYAKWGNDREQLNFIINQIKLGNENHQSKQTSFLE